MAREDKRLVMLVSHDTCPVALSELAYEIDLEIVPLVTTEVRLRQARRLVYRYAMSSRYDALLDKIGPTPTATHRVVIGGTSSTTGPLPVLPRRPIRRTIKRFFPQASEPS